PSLPLQTKLTIAQSQDAAEQEADRTAAQVVSQLHRPQLNAFQLTSPPSPHLPQKFPKITNLQLKAASPTVCSPSAAGLFIPATLGTDLTTEIGQGIGPRIARSRQGGQPLAGPLRRPMEQVFGQDFSQVRVHTDATADSLNRSLQAQAFTSGQDVFFRRGSYNPRNRAGQELIAHELTHVVQQSQLSTPQLQPYIQRKSLRSKLEEAIDPVPEIIERYSSGRTDAKKLRQAISALAEDRMTAIVTGLVQTPEGRDTLKALVVSMGSGANAAEKQFGCLAIAKAFGIENVEGFGGTALSRLWSTLEMVPAKHLNTADNTSLRSLVRQADNWAERRGAGTSWYKPGEQTATIAYGSFTLHHTHGGADKLLRTLGMPFITSPDSRLASKNLFTQTVLHEIGHAVNNKLRIMDRFGKQSLLGGWQDHNASPTSEIMRSYDATHPDPTYNSDTVSAVVTGIVNGSTLNAVLQDKVNARNKERSNWNKYHPDDLQTLFNLEEVIQKYRDNPAIRAAQLGGDKFVLGGAKGAWQLSDDELSTVALDGRVFHKAYAGTGDGCAQDTWVSYELAARKDKVSLYQWRAPDEWFAEIYANYFLGILPSTHPVYEWFKTFVAQNDHIDPEAIDNPTEWQEANDWDT
ncbi:MAG: DUF4157 domain-containing protein, partial [Synechococcales bacterium]|nr:DUF4157 domain-containing protein [Synechococcales bacterium]